MSTVVNFRLPLCFFLAIFLIPPSFAIDCKAPLDNPLFFEKQDSTRSAPSGLWSARSVEGARTQYSPVSQQLIESHLRLSVLAQGVGNLPAYLQPQALIYILDSLSLSEQARLSSLLEQAATKLIQNVSTSSAGVNPSIEVLLATCGDPVILERVKNLNSTIERMRDEHKHAVKLAIQYHDEQGQMYGDKPYSTHLRKVRSVLKRFGYGPKDSILGLVLGTAAWLHDIVEDTSLTRAILENVVGRYLAEIVSNLTNEPDREGLSKEEQKRITFERVAQLPESRILKVADRIANVEESLTNQMRGKVSKLDKYYREWPQFKKLIKKPGEAEKMWEHLERLLTDQDYARQFILFSAAP